MRVSDDAIYLTDNGAALCGKHLGHSAKTTGRDLSGQKILKITKRLQDEFERDFGKPFACETCDARLRAAATRSTAE